MVTAQRATGAQIAIDIYARATRTYMYMCAYARRRMPKLVFTSVPEVVDRAVELLAEARVSEVVDRAVDLLAEAGISWIGHDPTSCRSSCGARRRPWGSAHVAASLPLGGSRSSSSTLGPPSCA